MFTRLRIQNFKAWKDTGDIRMAPLTVFFGTNSSGKSSLIQFLLMLKQTAQSPDRKQVLNLGGSRSFVDLGVWPEMVFARNPQARLEFSFDWRVAFLNAAEMQGKMAPPSFSFRAAMGLPEGSEEPLAVDFFEYKYRFFSEDKWASLGMRRIGRTGQYALEASPPLQQTRWPAGVQIPGPLRFYGFPPDVEHISGGLPNADDCVVHLQQELDSVQYLGPLREMPARVYAWAGTAPTEVGIHGEQVLDAMLAARARVYQTAGTQEPVRFEQLIARWLVSLGLVESFEVKPIAPNRKEYEVLIRTPGSREQVSLADVGFGVSQILPVVVQLFCSERDSILAFEQPEIHLHPRAQTELADLFIAALSTWEQKEPRGVQLIVESHSEHLLRRIQRRIAEGTLKKEDAALYFCKPGPEGSTIEELKLDEYGRISNWPENFFGDAIGETEGQMEAMFQRMKREAPRDG